MTGILDRFTPSRTGFQPASMDELFALALAYRLGDHLAAEHYATLVSEHSSERLVRVYHRALKAARHGGSLATHFHAELKSGNGHVPSCQPVPLLAIKVERRSVAAVVFIGRHLEDLHVRHLSSAALRAQSSAVGFINWIMSNFPIESAAL